jgi:hypothetical protein
MAAAHDRALAAHQQAQPGRQGEGGEPGGQPGIGVAQRILDAGQGPPFFWSETHGLFPGITACAAS